MSANTELEGGLLVQRRGELFQLVAFASGDDVAAGRETDAIEIVAVGPANEIDEGAKGRRRGFDDQIAKGLPDDAADTEVGIIDAAGDIDTEIHDAVGIRQQVNGEAQRQIPDLRAADLFTQLQLVDDDVVGAPDKAVFERVNQLHTEAAAVDFVAGVGAG